jgi:hypothetical protein
VIREEQEMPQSDREYEGDAFRPDAANGAVDNERLALDDEDMSLPWLESDDDGVDEQGAGSGRIAGFLIGAFLVLVLLVGAFWWVNNRGSGEELLADGSTIKAPAQPYKEAPKDPGGKTFAGTGDTSFAVSVGQTRPARLGLEGGLPKDEAGAGKVVLKEIKAAPGAAASPTAPASPMPKGVGVQVGAYFKLDAAEAGWTTLMQRYEALSGYPHRVVEGKADIGNVYRLQAVAPDAASAQALCGRLKAAGLACQVKN